MYTELWEIIFVSLKVSIISTILVMTSSLFLASVFAFRPTKLTKFFEILIYLPMAMPPVALGYGLLLLFSHTTFFGITIAFNFAGAVIAAFFVSLGIGVRTLRAAFEEISSEQWHIAELLGAGRIEIFRHIILPQCKNAFLAGTILVFIRTLSEFGATIVLAGNSLGSTRTLALAIWVGMETPGQETLVIILVAIAIFISALALLLSEILLKSRRA